MEDNMNANKGGEKKPMEVEGFSTNGIMLKTTDFGKNQRSGSDGDENGERLTARKK